MDAAIERLGETVRIWGSSSSTDDLGNPVKVWDQDKGTFIGVVGRPKANDVLFAGGRISDTDKTLIAPSDANLATGDRVEIDSIIYDLYGTEADWKQRLGTTIKHLQLYLMRVP